MSSTRTRFALGLVVGGVLAAIAPTPAAPLQEIFGETVDVELVNVEVWVTDPQGRPVDALEADDFEVREDGEPVPITYFAEVRERPSAPAATGRRSSGAAAGAGPRHGPAVAETGHFVLYFDQLHLHPASRQRLIPDVRRFLASDSVPPERVLILRQDQKLVAEAAFGSSLEGLEAALSRLEATPAGGARSEADKHLALDRMQRLWDEARNQTVIQDPCGWFVPRAVQEVETYAEESRARISTTLDHLQSLASYLAGVPGVKTVVYLSDALETTPGSDLLSFVNGICPGQRDDSRFDPTGELSSLFLRFTRHAAANRITLYAVQGLGLRPGFGDSADQPAREFRGGGALELALPVSERGGLTLLASETGGRAVFNRNRFDDELAQIADEMSRYYSLAYVPPHGGDRGEHRIDVRVKGKKLRVRHRRAYRDKGPDERMAERLQGALYLGLVSNPLAARLGVGEVREVGPAKYAFRLHVAVPVENVVFLPQAEVQLVRLKLQVAASNDLQRTVLFDQKLYRLERPLGEEGSQGVYLDLVVDLEIGEGMHVLAVALRDEATRETSYISTTLALRPGADS